MNLKPKEKSEIINKLNLNIEQIIKLDDASLQSHVSNKLITPAWDFNEKSVRGVIKHYESILNQFISIQLKDVDFEETYIVKRNTTMDCIADIIVILSFIIEFSKDDDTEYNR